MAVLVTLGRHAAGSTYYPLVFSNRSSSPCSLAGYPTVWFVVTGGGATPPASDSGAAAEIVVVPPGGAAHATLQISNAGNYDPTACKPADARLLRVLPPGQAGDVLAPLEVDFTPAETQVCLGHGNLGIGPLTPGVRSF